MAATWAVFRRELRGYFNTPLAYIFIVIFLFLTGIFTFYLGSFFLRGQADLKPFFNFHPWLYLFLVPAIAIASFSFLTHFNAIQNGVIDIRDLIYFISLILLWLFANLLIVDLKKPIREIAV